jgi:serine protease Do
VIVDGFPVGTGTAWFVDEGLLFTNAHNVFEPGSEIQGLTHDGRELDLEVVDFVEEFPPDVALLRTPHRGATPLPMARVDDLEAGQPLVQVGHPGEVGYWIISMGRFVEASQSYSSDGTEYTALTSVVPGRRGVSGSPVLTLDGEVVGMTHGGEDFEVREMGEPATVAPDIVFDGPIGAMGMSLHDGSDILERKLEEWR